MKLLDSLLDSLLTLLSAVAMFLVPEKEVNAKLVFDNVRNYIVVGAVFAVASWLRSGGRAHENPFFNSKFESLLVHDWVFYLALALFCLNLLQSYELLRRFVFATVAQLVKLIEHYKVNQSMLGILLALVTAFTFLVAAVAMSLILLIVGMAVVTYDGFTR